MAWAAGSAWARLNHLLVRMVLATKGNRRPASTRPQTASLALSRFQAAAILAPHPDDEVLGCFHLIQALGTRSPVTLVYVTSDRRPEAAARRRAEADRASERLPIADRRWWEFPDGELAQHVARLNDELVSLHARHDLVASPAPTDLTADHAVLGQAVLRCVPPQKILWYRSTWLTFPLRDADVVAEGDAFAKLGAIDEFRSQRMLALRNVVALSAYEARACGLGARSVEAFRFAGSGPLRWDPVNALSVRTALRPDAWA